MANKPFNPVIGEATNSAALEELRKAVLSQPANMLPPFPEISKGGQVALGLLGALDPEAFQTTVLPLLREQASRGMLTEEAASQRREQNIRALQSLAGLESAQAGREAASAQRDEALSIRRAAEARQQEEAERKAELEAQESTDRKHSFETLANKSKDVIEPFSKLAQEMSDSENPDERSAAMMLVGALQGITHYVKKLDPNDPEYDPQYRPTKIDVDGFQKVYDDAIRILDQIQGQQAGRRQAAITAEAQLDKAAAAKAAKGIGPIERREYDARLNVVRGVNQIYSRINAIRDQIFRGASPELVTKSVEYKNLRSDISALNAPEIKKQIGAAQAGGEFERIQPYIAQLGAFTMGDAENVLSAVEGLQIKMFREATASLDTLEAAGFNVSKFRTMMEQEFSKAPPRVRIVTDVPPIFPHGSVLLKQTPEGKKLIKVYDPNTGAYLPEPQAWAPEQP